MCCCHQIFVEPWEVFQHKEKSRITVHCGNRALQVSLSPFSCAKSVYYQQNGSLSRVIDVTAFSWQDDMDTQPCGHTLPWRLVVALPLCLLLTNKCDKMILALFPSSWKGNALMSPIPSHHCFSCIRFGNLFSAICSQTATLWLEQPPAAQSVQLLRLGRKVLCTFLKCLQCQMRQQCETSLSFMHSVALQILKTQGKTPIQSAWAMMTAFSLILA